MNITFDELRGGLNTTINGTRPVSEDIQLKLYNIFIPILGVIVIFVNLIIVLSSGLILRRGQQPRSTYIFLGNIALSDLIIGIAAFFSHICPHKKRNKIVCFINAGMTVSSTLVSVYTIGLIAVDRYLYIIYGLRYQRYLSTKRARIMVICTWILGAVVGYLPAMGIRNDTNTGHFCWFILEPPALVVTATCIGLIPFIVIIVLYSIILRTALDKIEERKKASERIMGANVGTLRLFRGSSATNISETPDQQMYCKRSLFNCFKESKTKEIAPSSLYNPKRWKAIKIVVYTTGSFFITWFPFFIAFILHTACDPDETPRYCDNLKKAIARPLAFLGLSNSLLNPIIYAWWHNGFWESITKIYNGFWWECCQPKLDFKKCRGTLSKPSKDMSVGGVTTDVDTSDTDQRMFTHSPHNSSTKLSDTLRTSGVSKSETD